MTLHEYRSLCDSLLRETFGDSRGDAYFDMHSNRVHEWLVRFDLFKPLGNLLDIGPFFSLTPFLLQPNSVSVSVLEGDDPASDPLVKMYERRGIPANFTDLNELFGFPQGASRRLPYGDDQFDTILCWETMEHFSFNPVPFVKELGRIAKADARIIVIVPDRASIYSVRRLYFGNMQEREIDALCDTADYVSNGKHVFHGLHWREYTRKELRLLFEKNGFEILQHGGLQGFYGHQYRRSYLPFRLARKALFRLSPLFGTDAYVVARPKKAAR